MRTQRVRSVRVPAMDSSLRIVLSSLFRRPGGSLLVAKWHVQVRMPLSRAAVGRILHKNALECCAPEGRAPEVMR
jgi:hypothetical protein